MLKTSHILLTDYQRAILNEMDISSWQLAVVEKDSIKLDKPILEVLATSTEVTSKDAALAKLKQLKIHTKTAEVTDSVLVTFSLHDAKLQIFKDVLMALGLEAKSQKNISVDEVSHYSSYPLVWVQGEKVSLDGKHLTTPSLAELQHFETKKQLWLQLHNAISVAKG